MITQTSVVDIFDAGVKAYSSERYEESLQNFEEVIERITAIRPPALHVTWLSASYNWKGRILERHLGDPDSALKFYDMAVEVYAKNDGALNNRGLLLMDHYNDIEGAEKDFMEAITVNPTNDDVLNNLGLLLEKKEKFDEALVYFNKSLSVNSRDAVTYSNRAKLLTERFGRHADALADYNTALQLNPNYAVVYRNRGLLYMDHYKRYEDALADYNKAIEISPSFQIAYNHRGILYRDFLRNYDKALEDFDTLIKLNRRDFTSYGHKSYVLYLQGKFQEATEFAQQAISIGNARFAYYVKGLLYEREGKSGLAKESYQKFIELGCWNPSFLQDAKTRLKELDKGSGALF